MIRILFLLIMGVSMVKAQVMPLWPQGVPNCPVDSPYEEIRDPKIGRKTQAIQTPSIEVFLPEEYKATGQAILICPGGGYYLQAYDWEGVQFAKWLNTQGIAAMVLKYRLPHWSGEGCREHVALDDARRAMRIIRFNATSWNIDPHAIGVMGFSAGGHLAASLATQPQDESPLLDDSISHQPAHANFAALIYPVISAEATVTHEGSIRNLLGEGAGEALRTQYSAEQHVNSQTPPTFLLHASDDGVVPAENSIRFYQALLAKGIPAELHILPKGGHGFAMAESHPQLQHWPTWLERWLKQQLPN